MVGTPHCREPGRGHVARDAQVTRAILCVMSVGHRVVDGLLVARKARFIGLGHLEAGPAAAGVAVVAVELSSGDARAL